MLQELIARAREIEASQNIRLSAAATQVSKNLSLDELEAIFSEVERGSARLLKRLNKVRERGDGPIDKFVDETIDGLRDSAANIILNAR